MRRNAYFELVLVGNYVRLGYRTSRVQLQHGRLVLKVRTRVHEISLSLRLAFIDVSMRFEAKAKL